MLDKESFKSDKKIQKGHCFASLMNKISVKLSSKQDNTGPYYSKTENCFRIQRSLVRMLLWVSSWICLLDNSWTCMPQKKEKVTLVWVKVVNKRVLCCLKRQIVLCIKIEEQLFIKWSTSRRKPWLVKMDAQLWCQEWKEASYWEGIVHSKWNYERQIGNFTGGLNLPMKRILFSLRSEIISASTL